MLQPYIWRRASTTMSPSTSGEIPAVLCSCGSRPAQRDVREIAAGHAEGITKEQLAAAYQYHEATPEKYSHFVIDRTAEEVPVQYVEVYPLDQKQVITETKAKDSDQLLWFHKAVLEVRGHVVQSKGTDYTADTPVALVNGGLWSLFEMVQLQVNNKIVEELQQYDPW